jgi:cyclopropane fatty-acyl-phospholipid synthase-like methyltransferase
MEEKKYLNIISGSEADLEQYGDDEVGISFGSPKKTKEDVYAKYKVMLEVIKPDTRGRIQLLEFGCGASHFYEYILQQKLENIEYSGLDLSEKMIRLSRSKFPAVNYYHLDILNDPVDLPIFDYVVLNGVFPYKDGLTFDEMLAYFQAVVHKVMGIARVGIAFNVQSKQVDWERDDLFHLPFDTLASFLTKAISRKFILRHDYGLYEYTTYVYK